MATAKTFPCSSIRSTCNPLGRENRDDKPINTWLLMKWQRRCIFQKQYITLCQFVFFSANGFTKGAEDPLNFKIYSYTYLGTIPVRSGCRLVGTVEGV